MLAAIQCINQFQLHYSPCGQQGANRLSNLNRIVKQICCIVAFNVDTPSMCDGCLLSTWVASSCRDTPSPPIGFRQGCSLRAATLFGIFIDSLHHHLQSTCPDAVVKICFLCLTDLVYADDICPITTSAAQSQALIDALATVLSNFTHANQCCKDEAHVVIVQHLAFSHLYMQWTAN